MAGSDGVESVGALKVTCLVVLVSVVRAFSLVVAASFSTLNFSIPRQSDATCESRIGGHAEYSRM